MGLGAFPPQELSELDGDLLWRWDMDCDGISGTGDVPKNFGTQSESKVRSFGPYSCSMLFSEPENLVQ